MSHPGLRILIFIVTIIGVKSDYVPVGCFRDSSRRAISGPMKVFQQNIVVRKCYERAKAYGNEYFAVQAKKYCFTSSNAGQTYHKYGRVSGCRHGRGGSWRQDVYKIKNHIASIMGRVNKNYEARWNQGVNTCTGACDQKYDTLAGDMELVALGLEAGETILDTLGSGIGKQWKKVAGLMQKFAPFLGAMGPIVGIIGSFGDSEEMQRLNFVVDMLSEGFQHINNRFNGIELRLGEMKRLIQEQHIVTRTFDDIHYMINTNTKIRDYLEAVRAKDFHYATIEKRVILGMKRNLFDAVETLVNVFIGRGTPQLCMTMIKVLAGDIQQVMDNVLPLYSRLIQGVSDYLLILGFEHQKRGMDRSKRRYLRKLKQVHSYIDRCNRAYESRLWLDYWQKDLTSVRKHHPKNQERQLADKIYVRLSAKYNWRHWLVAVYRDIYGSNNHWRMVCTGAHTWQQLHWAKKYNIMVTSVSPRKSSLASKLRISFPKVFHPSAKSLWLNIERRIRTCTYPISAVVVDHIPIALQAPSRRSYYQKFTIKRCHWVTGGWWWAGAVKICKSFKFQAFVMG